MSIEMEDGTLRIQQIIAQAEEELQSTQVHKDIPLEVDPGNLAVVDINFLDESSLRNTRERDAFLLSIGRDGVQMTISEMYQLERTTVDNLPFIVLPAPQTALPREKPIPKAAPLTKWQQYAKDKGIVKKKKDKKVWDDVAQDFVPRYGKLRVQVEKDKNWVIEIPRQADPFEDQFAKAAKAKKERIAKNEFQRLRNIARAGKDAVPGVGVTRTDTRDVAELKKAMHFSRQATASLGKFQPQLKGEKPIAGFTKKARRDVDKPFVGAVREERDKSLGIIDRLNKPTVNTESAVIKQVEKSMLEEQATERRSIKKTGRRSKLGGRREKKSGAALASLTDGKMGDKRSRKVHAAAKAAAGSGVKQGAKGGRAANAKNSKKSVFGGAFAEKKTMMKNGKSKNVVKKRKR